MSETIQIDKETLEDIYAKIASIPSQMIVLLEMIDGIQDTDTRKMEYRNKTLAIDLTAITRDFSQSIADALNQCIAEGGANKPPKTDTQQSKESYGVLLKIL